MTIIDESTDVIIEVSGGSISDYYVPKGMNLIIVDRDLMECGEADELTLAAAEFLEVL